MQPRGGGHAPPPSDSHHRGRLHRYTAPPPICGTLPPKHERPAAHRKQRQPHPVDTMPAQVSPATAPGRHHRKGKGTRRRHARQPYRKQAAGGGHHTRTTYSPARPPTPRKHHHPPAGEPITPQVSPATASGRHPQGQGDPPQAYRSSSPGGGHHNPAGRTCHAPPDALTITAPQQGAIISPADIPQDKTRKKAPRRHESPPEKRHFPECSSLYNRAQSIFAYIGLENIKV